MRFKKRIWPEYEDTRRKRLALALSQQRQRDSLPLLAEIIKEQQPSADEVMTARKTEWADDYQKARAQRAQSWRAVRRELFTFEPELRHAICSFWNSHRWFPGEPNYLHYVLRCVRTGKFVQDGATLREEQVIFTKEELAEMRLIQAIREGKIERETATVDLFTPV
jgi:hypothetical protein